MSADDRKNPLFELFGKLSSQPTEAMKTWEKWLAGRFDQLARNDRFLGQMGKAMESSMLLRASINRMMEQSLHNMRLPSLGDVEGLHGRLDQIERTLDRLTRQLESADADNTRLVARLDAFAARNTELAERLESALGGAGEAA